MLRRAEKTNNSNSGKKKIRGILHGINIFLPQLAIIWADRTKTSELFKKWGFHKSESLKFQRWDKRVIHSAQSW